MAAPAEEDSKKRRKNLLLMALVSIGAVFFAFLMFIVLTFASFFWHILIPSPWMKEFGQGMDLWYKNRSQAEQKIKQSIALAEQSKAPLKDLVNMHKQYGEKLYWVQEYFRGDNQIDIAVSLVKGDPPASLADDLACAYQSKAWNSEHSRFCSTKAFHRA